MEKFEKDLNDFYGKIKESEAPGEDYERRIFLRIKKRIKDKRMRNFVFTLFAGIVIFAFLLSMITPVFGRNGTLGQYINGIRIERNLSDFTGSLSIDEELINKVSSANINPSDAILVKVLSSFGISTDEILNLRDEGYGWGVILAKYDVSIGEVQSKLNELKGIPQQSNNVKEEHEKYGNEEKNAENNKEQNNETNREQNNEANKEQNNEVNREQNYVLVIKGEIQEIADSSILVSEKKIFVNEGTEIKNGSDLLTLSELKLGSNVLVQAKVVGEQLIALRIVFLSRGINNNGGSDKSSENGNKGNSNENSQDKKTYVFNGIIEEKGDGFIKVENTRIEISDQTSINSAGKVANFEDLKLGDKVNVKCYLESETYRAYSITVVSGQSNQNVNNQNPESSTIGSEKKEYELRTYILSISGNMLSLMDFDKPVQITDETNIQKQDEGRVDISSLVQNSLVQIHIRNDEENYLATSIVILFNPQYKKESYQGEVSIKDVTNRIILLKDNGIVFKVEEKLQGSTSFEELTVGDSVSLTGIPQPDGTVVVEKITVLAKGKKGKN